MKTEQNRNRKLSKKFNYQSTQSDSIYSRNGLNAYVYKFMQDLEIESIQRNMVENFLTLHMLMSFMLVMSCLKSKLMTVASEDDCIL